MNFPSKLRRNGERTTGAPNKRAAVITTITTIAKSRRPAVSVVMLLESLPSPVIRSPRLHTHQSSGAYLQEDNNREEEENPAETRGSDERKDSVQRSHQECRDSRAGQLADTAGDHHHECVYDV